MASGKGEFSGGPGMVQPEQIGDEDSQQQVWELYATNPSGLAAGDGSEKLDNAPGRIGRPLETYTPGD
jgi:hypothetical protein